MTEQDLTSLVEEVLEERKKKRKKSKKKKEDRCTRIAKRKYDVWPSAYASGAVVRCRKGKIWKGLKEEELAEISEEELLEILAEEEDETLEEKKRKLTKKPSSETSLRDWFKRKGEPGKGGGWVDCNSPIRKDGKITGYKSCGRSGKDDKRSKYPACRPTPSACKSKGRGKSWGKKSAKGMKESMNNLQEQIENEILALLSEAKEEEVKDLIGISNQKNHIDFFNEDGSIKTEKEEEYNIEVKKYLKQLSNIPKQYLSWVQKMSSGDPEPLDEIISMLKAYLENKSKFQGTKLKNLTPGGIRQKIEDLGEDSDQKSSEKISQNNDKIYESNNWVGVYPKTKEGSINACKNLSAGVQWCTAATKTENYFDSYTGEYNIHLYYFFRKGGNTRSNPNDAIAIGWVKKDGKLQIIHKRNATVNATNKDLSESDLQEVFGSEWSSVKDAMLQDLGKEERKETAFNKIVSNLTPETLNAQLTAINDPKEQIQTLLHLLKNEIFVQNKERTNFATLKLSKMTLDLNLYNTEITTLPDNLKVGGNLNLPNTKITTLPDNLKVGGNLDLPYTKITTLPDNLKVGGDLNLPYTEITTLPNNFEVGGSLNLYKTKIITLPDNLKVGGNLDLPYTEITTLPDNLKVGGDLDLYKTKITTLPDNLEVGGEIIGSDGKKIRKASKKENGSMENIEEQILLEVMQLLESTNISEGMQYHIDNKIPLTEVVYRPLSEGFMSLMKEARNLYSLGLYEALTEEEKDILESDLGDVGVCEGQEVPLDIPMVEEQELDEAEYKGKEVELGKPKKGGSKKYYVYVRNPKTGNVKKVSYGSPDMKSNWNDPEARKSFAARHKCAEKKDKTSPGWWSCRAHRHFGKNVSGTYW
jgi:hypothetical protein